MRRAHSKQVVLALPPPPKKTNQTILEKRLSYPEPLQPKGPRVLPTGKLWIILGFPLLALGVRMLSSIQKLEPTYQVPFRV